MFVYVSEQDYFTDFDNPSALFWLEEELVYGDWTSGENQDGSYVKTAQIEATQVCLTLLHL